jgi:tetratricopeptide (TPR) repeat protein
MKARARQARSKRALASPKYDVFISYRRIDRDPVRALVSLLTKEHGLTIWIDEVSIESFDSSTVAIRDGIARSRTFLAWYSAAYPQSRPCQWELTNAYLAAQAAGPVRDRVLVVNPEAGNDHVQPIELRDQNFRHSSNDDVDELETTAAAIAARVDRVDSTPLGDIRVGIAPQWYGRAPIGSNRFVGRLASLWTLHTALFAPDHAIVAQRTSGIAQVRGLGGIGKTLFVEEYAVRFGAAFPHGVFWLRAPGPTANVASLSRDQRASIRDDQLRSIGLELGIDPEVVNDPRRTTAALRHRLTKLLGDTPGAFLWVVDDLPSGLTREELDMWVAPHPGGRTVITTRSREHDAYGTPVDLDNLAPEEAVELLSMHRVPEDQVERAVARQLAADIGHHPLALELAGSALAAGRGLMSFADYREQLAAPQQDALEVATRFTGELPTGHEGSIAATFLRSVKSVGDEGLDFLRLAAQLAAAPIPASLVAAVFSDVDGLTDAEALERVMLAFGQCERLSLADPIASSTRGERLVHALVGRTLRFRDDLVERQNLFRDAAVRALTDVLADVADVRLHRQRAVDVAHARHLLLSNIDGGATIGLLDRLARFDLERGEHASAVELSQRYVDVASDTYGVDHPRTLLAQGDLARALKAIGRNAAAREFEEHVLDARLRLLGADHLDTLTAKNNLAATLHSLGDVRRASQLHRQVLEARTQLLGRDHPHTLFSLNNLGAALTELDELSEAERVLEEAADRRRKVLGADHADTLTAESNLIAVLLRLDQTARARQLAESVMRARTRVLGESHPRTLYSAASLGRLLIAAGEFPLARDVLARPLHIAIGKLGEDDLTTLVLMNNLAKALVGLGDLDGAAPFQQRALDGSRRVFGDRHDLTTRFALNMFELLRLRGEVTAAEEIRRSLLSWVLATDPTGLGFEQRAARERLLLLNPATAPD